MVADLLAIRFSTIFANGPSRDDELDGKVTAKVWNVTLRRRAEEFLVVAAEVRRVFVAHSVPGTRRV